MIIACSKLLYIDKCRSNLGFSKLDGWDRVDGVSTFTKLEAQWCRRWKMKNRRIPANTILQTRRSHNCCWILQCGFLKIFRCRQSVPLQTGSSLVIIIGMFYVPVNTKEGVWIKAKTFPMMEFQRLSSYDRFPKGENWGRFFTFRNLLEKFIFWKVEYFILIRIELAFRNTLKSLSSSR